MYDLDSDKYAAAALRSALKNRELSADSSTIETQELIELLRRHSVYLDDLGAEKCCAETIAVLMSEAAYKIETLQAQVESLLFALRSARRSL
jgi:hypothetical protein